MDELTFMGYKPPDQGCVLPEGAQGWRLRMTFDMSEAHPSFFPFHRRAFHIPAKQEPKVC